MADGLKITLKGVGNGLTVDKQGRMLLPKPFVFQCSPLEEYAIVHAINMGMYDTIDNDQFMRRGSRQLNTWTFDTLAMYLGAFPDGHYGPRWVPHPTREPSGTQYHRPEWYRDQMKKLHDAGAPFKYTAAFTHSTTIHSCNAVLTGFNEVYKHGEGDAIYFSSVAFTEWRDPGGATPPKPKGHPHVGFRRVGNRYIAFDAVSKRNVPTKSKTHGTTLMDLARCYYGNGAKWRLIASANHLKGGGGNTPIFTHWYPHKLSRGVPNVWVLIPAEMDLGPIARVIPGPKGPA